MNPEFLKSLIQLLAQHGGTFTCPLSELTPLGLELSLQNLSSDNAATLTLRLGARIYYVPAATTTLEEPCPSTPNSRPPTGPTRPSATSQVESLPGASAIAAEISAVNSLNNRQRSPSQASPTPSPDVDESTSSTTAHHAPKIKSDLDLYLLEQNAATRRTAQAKTQAQELRNQTREYPWETRKPS